MQILAAEALENMGADDAVDVYGNGIVIQQLERVETLKSQAVAKIYVLFGLGY